MYIAVLLIFAVMIYGGFRSGIFESSFMLFRNLMAFLLAFPLFAPATGFLLRMAPRLRIYPGPEYLRAVLYAAVFIVFIGICDQLKFKYLFYDIDITTGKNPDRIGGAILGIPNAIVISGFILILWALLPFPRFMPGDSGRVHVDNLPVDSGAIMLKLYSRSSNRMGAKPFFLEGLESVDPDETAESGLPRRGWMWHYRHHADFTLHDMNRLSADVTVVEDDYYDEE